jgi:hypothetical protein
MDANAPLAAAAMFRRALQVITRDLLGAKPGNLGVELKEVVGKNYNGGVVTNNLRPWGISLRKLETKALTLTKTQTYWISHQKTPEIYSTSSWSL